MARKKEKIINPWLEHLSSCAPHVRRTKTKFIIKLFKVNFPKEEEKHGKV